MTVDWIDAIVGVSDIVSSHWPPPTPKPLWTLGKPSLDIVIAHGPKDKILTDVKGVKFSKPMSAGLVLTLMSCEEVLNGANLNYRYFVVGNGIAKSGQEREAFNGALEFLDKTGHAGKVFDVDHGMSPGAARSLGAAAGTADLLFFLDNHCGVREQFFSSAVKTFETTGADSVHGVTVYADEPLYHYILFLEEWFLGYPSPCPPPGLLIPAAIHAAFSNDRRCPPYRIAAAGHGAFAIKRLAWDEVGGYWDGFDGWGGEESYFELKLALLDKKNYLDPNMIHDHFLGGQKDYKNWPKYAENMIAAANIIGGTHWAEKIAASYHEKNVLEGGESKQYYDAMLSRAIERSSDHAKWLASKRLRTLDEQLAKFRQEGVAGMPPSKQVVAFTERINRPGSPKV